MPLRVDLHSHTTASDGRTPPRELVRLARAAGVDVLAVTDHDTVDAVEECLDEGRAAGVRIVPGIEMSSRFEGRDVHVLGYGLDWRSESLRSRLAEIQARRRERVGRICAALAEAGVALSPAEVLAEAGGKSVGRKHVARALLKKGTVRSLDEAFDRWLARDAVARIPVHEMSPQEAAEVVAAHGGVPVMAHPGFLDDDAAVERILDESPGLRGLEVFHRYESSTKHLAYLGMAQRRQLLVTGGSDFHGDEHPHNARLGDYLTPPEHWKCWAKRLGGL